MLFLGTRCLLAVPWCCWRKEGDAPSEAAGEGSLLHGEGPRWSRPAPTHPHPPEQSGSETLLITIFLPPAPTRRSGSPAAASLGTRKEQRPGAQPHLPPGYQRAAFSANRGDGGSEEPRRAQALRSPAAGQLPVPGRTRCHRQSPCSCYNREKKLCRSEQLNGSQTCSSAAFLRSVFMYLA